MSEFIVRRSEPSFCVMTVTGKTVVTLAEGEVVALYDALGRIIAEHNLIGKENADV